MMETAWIGTGWSWLQSCCVLITDGLNKMHNLGSRGSVLGWMQGFSNGKLVSALTELMIQKRDDEPLPKGMEECHWEDVGATARLYGVSSQLCLWQDTLTMWYSFLFPILAS